MHRPALRPTLAVALLAAAALALSGCAGKDAAAHALPAAADPGRMAIVGLVQDETFAPVAGAQVALRLANRTATTDAGGLFAFEGLALAPYLVDVTADGFAPATLTAEPRENVSLSFVLQRPATVAPPPAVLHFQGIIQCAFEAFIITPSCDSVADEAGQSVFEDVTTFEASLNRGWATAVVDVDFDPSAYPGLDGLRLTLQGRDDSDSLGTYERYGRFYGSGPFTARVEPGGTYEDGVAPVPQNATTLQLEVYPHGHGYHALCAPPAPCPLGVGTAQNVQFDVYVTIFYVDPAPEGYTLLDA